MFKIYQSNSLENLFECQNTLFDTPLTDPLSPEIILVQSQGMARWLALQTAGCRGIAGNINCLFPAAFVWRLVKLMTDGKQDDPFEPDTMVWAVVKILDEQINTPVFEELQRYLAGAGRSIRLYQLAQKIALQFDQYMVFRPDWIDIWSSGGETHWQAVLWRKMLDEFGPDHRVALLCRLLEQIDPSFVKRAKLPERLSLFGIPALPPSLFSIFSRLAEVVDVHFFLLNPSKEYWTDLLSPGEFVRLEVKEKSSHDLSEDLHYETGNSLLLSLGKMGRDFQLFLQQDDYEESSCFSQLTPHTVLGALQSDILNAAESPGALGVDDQDRSVQCHAVHSPLREVEVLSDNLLAMFQSDPSLTPADILVMVPDISRYAPLIEAVFGVLDEERHIPYTIADRSSVSSQEVVGAFMDLLDLAASRLYASSVLDFLTKKSVRSRFALQENDLDVIRNWLSETGIYWGLDEKHRHALGLPAEKQATWQMGLDRLLLGYALGDSDVFFLDFLPVDLVEGSLGKLLSRFLDFYASLRDFIRLAQVERSLSDWHVVLLAVLDDFFGSNESVVNGWPVDAGHFREKQRIRHALATLEQHGSSAHFSGKVPLGIIQAALAEELEKGQIQSNFLSGGVTFCQMVPMRSVPFRGIVLLGMNDADFPREDRPLGFDLMADDFRLCDRCRRDDDRYLFLEALLSARQFFYLSYVGIGLKNNEISAPSVVVGELLDALAKKYDFSESEVVRHFTLFHPLHPFSPRYFRGDRRLNHFSLMDFQTAEALGRDLPARGLVSGILPKQGPYAITVSEFIEFFCHPVRYFLKQRLGLDLTDRYSGIVDREMFSLDSLDNYSLLGRVMEFTLEGEVDCDALSRRLQANGEIPLGTTGRYAFEEAEGAALGLARRIRQQAGDTAIEPLAIDLDLGVVRVTGWLDNLWRNGQYLARPSKISNMNCRDYIRFWLSHLFLNVEDSGCRQHSFYHFLDGQKEYPPVSDALAELQELARLFTAGMRGPLPLLPKATMKFVKTIWKGGEESSSDLTSKALAMAKKIWFEGDFYNGPECEEPYLWAAFGSKDPFVRQSESEFDFVKVAEIVMKRAYLLSG